MRIRSCGKSATHFRHIIWAVCSYPVGQPFIGTEAMCDEGEALYDDGGRAFDFSMARSTGPKSTLCLISPTSSRTPETPRRTTSNTGEKSTWVLAFRTWATEVWGGAPTQAHARPGPSGRR